MSKLTKTEKRAYDALLREPGQTLPIDVLVERVYGDSPPASAGSGMTAIMRMLIVKSERQTLKVVRTSPLGRGSKAVYSLQKGDE
jgi:hypothetical protein